MEYSSAKIAGKIISFSTDYMTAPAGETTGQCLPFRHLGISRHGEAGIFRGDEAFMGGLLAQGLFYAGMARATPPPIGIMRGMTGNAGRRTRRYRAEKENKR